MLRRPAMPHAHKGVLITCDPPTREFILHQDRVAKKKNAIDRIVLFELDETHLFVDAGRVAEIKRQLEEHTAALNDFETK